MRWGPGSLLLSGLIGCSGDDPASVELKDKVEDQVVADVAGGAPREVIVILSESQVASPTMVSSYQGADGTAEGEVEVRAVLYNLAKQAIFEAVPDGGLRTQRTLEYLPVMFVTVRDLDTLRALAQREEVVRVVEDQRYGTQDSLDLIRAKEVIAAGKSGAGTSVAVLDTGLNYRHAAFGACTTPGTPAGCKVAYAADFAPDDGVLDDSGHGTNVAGIVSAVAPGAKLIGLDVFEGPYAKTSTILSAVNWVVANRAAHNIVAVNMSLGGGSFAASCGSDGLAPAITAAKKAGIFVAVAAGNDGNKGALASPACVPDAVSVGAVYHGSQGGWKYGSCSDPSSSADQVTCFSNSAPFLTMLAPGANITAAGLTMSGTSQATPHVAGAAAVLRGAFPGESVDSTLKRMTSTGKAVKDPRNGVTKPRLDLLAALNAPVTDTTPPTGTVIISAGDGKVTSSGAVRLTLAATDPSGVTRMCIANGASCSAWIPYASSSSWALLPGDGARSVSVWWADGAGNVSKAPVSASITVDGTAPTDGAASAAPGNGRLTLSWSGFADATSGIVRYLVVGGAAAPASCTAAPPLWSGADRGTVLSNLVNGTTYSYRVCAVDAAGNISKGATVSARPVPESDPPRGSVVIAGNAIATATTSVQLTLSATDASGVAKMCISNTTTCTSFVPYAATWSWTLPAGEGAKTVYAQFQDVWGHTSARVADTIILDQTRPLNGTMSATRGAGQVTLQWASFSDAGSGIGGYRVVFGTSSLPASCSAGTVLYTGTGSSFVHSGLRAGVTHYYRVCAVDNAGNQSTGSTRSAVPL